MSEKSTSAIKGRLYILFLLIITNTYEFMAAILPNNSKTFTLNLELTVVWLIAVFLFLTPQVLIMVSSKCDTKQPLHKLLKTFLPLRLEIVGVD